MTQIIAPAKINLFLHVTGKDQQKYHQLQSLVAFADFGDLITVNSAEKYSLKVTGDFSGYAPIEHNLVTKAVKGLAELTGHDTNISIHLQKNIPVGAGLGGGSADAAAIIKALIEFWDINIDKDKLDALLKNLGADVPMCFDSKTAFIEGIGEKISPINLEEELNVVLVYPNIAVDTSNVFQHFNQEFSKPVSFKMSKNLVEYLSSKNNDLTKTAISLHPEIDEVLKALKSQPDCDITRMSGSGSCCFGLFKYEQSARNAYKELAKNHPDWWVKQTKLNCSN